MGRIRRPMLELQPARDISRVSKRGQRCPNLKLWSLLQMREIRNPVPVLNLSIHRLLQHLDVALAE
jgi:hypothetical protein